MDIDRVNTIASKWTILGWFAGLAYFNWFASDGTSLSWWTHALLIIVGMFAASIIIGGGIALLFAGVTKALTGRPDGSIDFFAWGAFISPIFAFFAAKYVLAFVAGI
ncbi:MAG: hypothetical protein KIT20_04455 [Alphaproteobacteria bacterium]|nr:hypothetical protein [Alphaproteobacteria bacterium]